MNIHNSIYYFFTIRQLAICITAFFFVLAAGASNQVLASQEFEPIPTSAQRLRQGIRNSGRISSSSETDWFVFNVVKTRGTLISVSTSGDSVIRLYRRNSNRMDYIREDDDGGPGQSSKLEVCLDAGTYYVGLTGWGGDTFNYSIEVDVLAFRCSRGSSSNTSSQERDITVTTSTVNTTYSAEVYDCRNRTPENGIAPVGLSPERPTVNIFFDPARIEGHWFYFEPRNANYNIRTWYSLGSLPRNPYADDWREFEPEIHPAGVGHSGRNRHKIRLWAGQIENPFRIEYSTAWPLTAEFLFWFECHQPEVVETDRDPINTIPSRPPAPAPAQPQPAPPQPAPQPQAPPTRTVRYYEVEAREWRCGQGGIIALGLIPDGERRLKTSLIKCQTTSHAGKFGSSGHYWVRIDGTRVYRFNYTEGHSLFVETIDPAGDGYRGSHSYQIELYPNGQQEPIWSGVHRAWDIEVQE